MSKPAIGAGTGTRLGDAMDLPEAKGTYVLIALVTRMKRLEIGSLGACDIVPAIHHVLRLPKVIRGLRWRHSA